MASLWRSALHSGLHHVGLDLVRWPRPSNDYPPEFDENDRDTMSKVAPYTKTPPARVAALIDAVKYIHRANIPGSVVECGVWKGGSMMAAALTLRHLGDNRDVYLYDTFDGMTEPTALDVDRRGRSAADLLRAQPKVMPNGKAADSTWSYAPLEEVQDALRTTGYPERLMHFVKGPVEETIPQTMPDQISLLRLDTDWYESTRHELEHLYPLLAPGGVLIIDDYGAYLGARKATDEYLAGLSKPILLSRIDFEGRMTVKP